MGTNVVTRCVTCGETAFFFRGKEAASSDLWLARHNKPTCTLEWAVDNHCSTLAWADEESDFCLPDDLLVGKAAR